MSLRRDPPISMFGHRPQYREYLLVHDWSLITVTLTDNVDDLIVHIECDEWDG